MREISLPSKSSILTSILFKNIESNNLEAAKSTIAAGANIESDHSGETALLFAVRKGRGEIVRHLLDIGADVNANIGGNTSLHVASCSGYDDIVKELISAGAQLTHENKRGATPIHLAATYGKIKTCKLLLEYGGLELLDKKDANGFGPLELLVNFLDVSLQYASLPALQETIMDILKDFEVYSSFLFSQNTSQSNESLWDLMLKDTGKYGKVMSQIMLSKGAQWNLLFKESNIQKLISDIMSNESLYSIFMNESGKNSILEWGSGCFENDLLAENGYAEPAQSIEV